MPSVYLMHVMVNNVDYDNTNSNPCHEIKVRQCDYFTLKI